MGDLCSGESQCPLEPQGLLNTCMHLHPLALPEESLRLTGPSRSCLGPPSPGSLGRGQGSDFEDHVCLPIPNMNFHLMNFSSHLGGKDLELFLQVKQKSRIFPKCQDRSDCVRWASGRPDVGRPAAARCPVCRPISDLDTLRCRTDGEAEGNKEG